MNKYEAPSMEILSFGAEDVIATSIIEDGSDKVDWIEPTN